MTINKDGRFSEFLDLIKKTPKEIPQEYIDEWADEIRLRFSIGSIRYLLRTQAPKVKYFVAECLARNVRTADEASCALSCWSKYDEVVRLRLVTVILTSTESTASNQAAYVLTRTRQVRWLSPQMYILRGALIEYLRQRKDNESIEHALRFDEVFGSPVEKYERVLLQEMLQH